MNMNYDIDQMTVQQLRDEGYAVVIWSPEDLNGCPPVDFEDSSVEWGQEIIDCYGGKQ